MYKHVYRLVACPLATRRHAVFSANRDSAGTYIASSARVANETQKQLTHSCLLIVFNGQ